MVRSTFVPMRQLRAHRPADVLDVDRSAAPRTRGECRGGQRPCPWIACRHHLAVDVTHTGALILPFGEDPDLHAMPETCVLDVAERGGLVLDQVAEFLNVTRERVRQVEVRAIERIVGRDLLQAADGDLDLAHRDAAEVLSW